MKEKLTRADFINPQNINKDVWFYATPKGFDFVVWVSIEGKRVATQFRLTHKKIKKFLK